MANWTQKKLLLTIGGAAFAVCAAAGGGVYYAQGLIAEIGEQVQAKNEEIAAAERKIAQIPEAEKEVIILRENLDEYVKILPDTAELNGFVRMLNQFERQSGILGTGLIAKNQRLGKATGKFTPIEYTYEMTATLWQALKFMNLIENYERFVSITEFSISQASGTTRGQESREGDQEHSIKLTLQTYAYNKTSDSKEVAIPDYANRKKELNEEILKRIQAIRIAHHDHHGAGGRRDIFVDPRQRGDLRVDGPSQADQRAVLDRYTTQITQLQEMLTRIRKADTTLFEQYSLEKRFKADLSQLLGQLDTDAGRIVYAPYKLRWAKEVQAPLEALQAQLDASVAVEPQKVDPYLPKDELQQLVAEMASDCANGQLEQARDRYDAVAERLNVPPEDARHELAVAAKAWQLKAATAIEFKSLELKIEGVVVNHEGRSGVLMNGDVYEEGDYVAEDLLVKTVEEEQVWFVFRGLTLVRTM